MLFSQNRNKPWQDIPHFRRFVTRWKKLRNDGAGNAAGGVYVRNVLYDVEWLRDKRRRALGEGLGALRKILRKFEFYIIGLGKFLIPGFIIFYEFYDYFS